MKPKPEQSKFNRYFYDIVTWIVYGLTIAFALLVAFWIVMAVIKMVGWA
jgi:hypothetical protein